MKNLLHKIFLVIAVTRAIFSSPSATNYIETLKTYGYEPKKESKLLLKIALTDTSIERRVKAFYLYSLLEGKVNDTLMDSDLYGFETRTDSLTGLDIYYLIFEDKNRTLLLLDSQGQENKSDTVYKDNLPKTKFKKNNKIFEDLKHKTSLDLRRYNDIHLNLLGNCRQIDSFYRYGEYAQNLQLFVNIRTSKDLNNFFSCIDSILNFADSNLNIKLKVSFIIKTNSINNPFKENLICDTLINLQLQYRQENILYNNGTYLLRYNYRYVNSSLDNYLCYYINNFQQFIHNKKIKISSLDYYFKIDLSPIYITEKVSWILELDIQNLFHP